MTPELTAAMIDACEALQDFLSGDGPTPRRRTAARDALWNLAQRLRSEPADTPAPDESAALAAPQPQPEPVAFFVYFPNEQRQEFFDSEEDMGYIDSLTNSPDAEVTPLYAAPQSPDVARQYEELRAAIDGGSESMTHEDALAVVRACRCGEVVMQPAQPEPVLGKFEGQWYGIGMPDTLPDGTELYAAPPTRAAVPLTDGKIGEIADSDECNPDDRGWGPKFSFRKFARAIERAAWKKKNGIGGGG